MQTLYYTTNNFVRHTGNIVDLSEYRRKLTAARREQMLWQEDAQPVEVQPRPRRSAQKRQRRTALLDLWASMGVLAMTVTFTVYVLCL